jgi:hypothetical protein
MHITSRCTQQDAWLDRNFCRERETGAYFSQEQSATHQQTTATKAVTPAMHIIAPEDDSQTRGWMNIIMAQCDTGIDNMESSEQTVL